MAKTQPPKPEPQSRLLIDNAETRELAERLAKRESRSMTQTVFFALLLLEKKLDGKLVEVKVGHGG